MKSAELEGAQLDYWVARALGYVSLSEIPSEVTGSEYHPHEPGCELRNEWSPSTDWTQGGQIIERNIAQLEHSSNDPGLAWNATNDNGDEQQRENLKHGSTSICRIYQSMGGRRRN